MNPRSVPALAQRLLTSLQDDRLKISPDGGQNADFRTPGQGQAIVFEVDGAKAAIPEFRPQEGLSRTIYYSRVRPKPTPLGEIIAIFTVSEDTPEP